MTTSADERPDLPEYRKNAFINRLPPILSIDEALSALTRMPDYREDERRFPAHIRCQCILRLARYFDPLDRHLQLELRISALIRQGYVGRNPEETDFIHRLHNDYERVVHRDLQAGIHPVESTASGIALIGCSGIGKTKSVERILHGYPRIIPHNRPFTFTQVVWLRLECPHKGSAKQLCISFFHEMDKTLGSTNYQERYGKSRKSLDEMVVRMAEVADRHALGVLVIDEIQHLMQAPGASRDDLLNFLVALVNSIGIPVLIIGTPAAWPLLTGAFRQARRASGLGSLIWENYENDVTWNYFVERMWRYQWTREPTPLTSDLRQVLYDESQGILDLVVKLYMLAQLHAIQFAAMTGENLSERLTVGLVKQAAEDGFQLIKPMILALKRGDRAAIAQYDDLTSIQDYVHQAFQNASIRLGPAPTTPMASPREPDGVTQDRAERLVATLEGLGLAHDIAEGLVAQAVAANPEVDTAELIGLVADLLRQRGPEAKPTKPKRVKPAKPTAPPDPADLRLIVAEGASRGLSAYVALRAAGAIRSPVEDLVA